MKCQFHRRLDRLVEWVEEASILRAQDQGGYADDIQVVADHLVVATLDGDNEPRLEVYTPEECMRWYKGIRRSMREEPEQDVLYHVIEGLPSVQEP